MAKHTQRHRLAGDIATAATAASGAPARFVKPTSSNMLVDVAKRLQRLQTRGARLRKESKRNDADIRAAKRELQALIQHVNGRGEL